MSNDEIKAAILALEAKQPRAIREGLLGDKAANEAAHVRLVQLDAQISALRDLMTQG